MVWNTRKVIDKTKWHKWFAWHPVIIAKNQDGTVQKAVFCIVQRKFTRWKGPYYEQLHTIYYPEYKAQLSDNTALETDGQKDGHCSA